MTFKIYLCAILFLNLPATAQTDRAVAKAAVATDQARFLNQWRENVSPGYRSLIPVAADPALGHAPVWDLLSTEPDKIQKLTELYAWWTISQIVLHHQAGGARIGEISNFAEYDPMEVRWWLESPEFPQIPAVREYMGQLKDFLNQHQDLILSGRVAADQLLLWVLRTGFLIPQ